MNKSVSLLSGIGIGVGLMYLFDPDRGRGRRALVRDKLVSAANRTPDVIGMTTRDLTNRARGLVAEVGSMLSREEVPDWVVAERVRTKLGSVVSHPSAVHVTADRGRVTLRGVILDHEIDELLRTVSAVRGVTAVDDQLESHKEPGNIPDLQGGRPRTGARFELMQQNWSPTARLLTSAVGAGLAVYGAIRKDPLGLGLGLGGAGLLARAATNIEVGRLVGVTGGQRAVDIQKVITINAPVEEVYRFWTNYENFPRFMTHVREVKDRGNGMSHWVVDGPAGVPVEWDAVVTQQIPNKELGWRSVEGAAIANSGLIRFKADEERSTQVQIRLSYNPPGGALGHSLAWLVGADPKRHMDDDLVRMKTLIESSVPPRDAAQPASATMADQFRATGGSPR